MIAQESYNAEVSDLAGNLLSRQPWIRIIYILERIQQDTTYCCSPCEAGEAGLGYSQPKILVQNKSLKSRLAWLACGVRNLKIQECF